MFKFGFLDDDVKNEADPDENIPWLESKEISPADFTPNNELTTNWIRCSDHEIKYISDKVIIQSLQSGANPSGNSLLSAEQEHSDLITGVYEGGLKIWECTFDLLDFIVKEGIDFKGKKVLDLGCGAGIVGILACLKGANVVFQDYNEEVIKTATIPNVALNIINCDNCGFYSGDWSSFLDLQKNSEKFNYIFTSETIYNINNYKKILSIFKELLVKNGIIYLAAKSHYFGVGGGIGHFEDFLKKEDIFDYNTTWVCSDGVKRAIIKIILRC